MKINLVAAIALMTAFSAGAQAQTAMDSTGTHPTTAAPTSAPPPQVTPGPTQTNAPTPAPMAAPMAAPAAAPAAPADSGMKAATKLSSSDKKFVMKASEAGLAEVAEAQLALQKSQRDDVKQFAQKMVDDHTKANDKLKDIISSSDAQPATAPDSTDQKMADKLGKLEGAKFDAKYISDQKSAHRQAVSLFEKESEKGKDPALKQFATETLPDLKSHYDMVKALPKK